MPIRRKPIKILSTHQSNRLLIYKPPRIRLIIPEEVVMQPCFRIIILVLQSEGVICTIRYLGFLFQSAPDGVVGESNQIVVLIGNLFRKADFGRSGSCGFVGGFHLLRWSGCGPVPRVCNCRNRCRYRYICRPCQCVGNDGLIFAVVERPFFAEVVAALEHFAVGVVTVVFVAGHQSVGLTVLNHDVIAVGETA